MIIPRQRFTLRARIKSFGYAFRGLVHVISEGHNFRVHMTAALAAVTLGLIFHISRTDWMIVILCIGFVISSEIMNSAIEKLTDIVSPQRNEMAGRVKDIAAGAVLIAAVTSLIAGLFVFLPHVIAWIKQI